MVSTTPSFPARLIGEREPGGGAVEVMLGRAWTMTDGRRWCTRPADAARPPGALRSGRRTLHGEVLEERYFGRRLVRSGRVMRAR